MNIIKHILCVGFAMTAFNAYGMLGFGNKVTQDEPIWLEQEVQISLHLHGFTPNNKNAENEYFADLTTYFTSSDWQAEVQKSPKAKKTAHELLSEVLSYSDLVKAQQEKSPTEKLPTTPTTSPVKPHFLDKKSSKSDGVRKQLTFDQ